MVEQNTNNNNQIDLPTPLGDVAAAYFDDQIADLRNPDEPALTPEMRERTMAAAKRTLEMNEVDLTQELDEAKERHESLINTYKEVPDEETGKVIQDLTRITLELQVKKDNLPPSSLYK